MAGYPTWSEWVGGGGSPQGAPGPQQQQPLLDEYGFEGGGYPASNAGLAPSHSVSFATNAKDPESVRARVFIGSLNIGLSFTAREDLIELCLPYGPLRAVTLFKNQYGLDRGIAYVKKQGYAFVQFESPGAADAACRELNGVRWRGCVMDVHPVDQPRSRGSSGQSSAASSPSSVKAVPTTNYDEISTNAKSKDPQLMRARVFLGSLPWPKPRIHRNEIIDLCLPYGKITAVAYFQMQGHAFIQFESPVDAVDACHKLNGLNWKGSVIDVHLAMEGSKRKDRRKQRQVFYL